MRLSPGSPSQTMAALLRRGPCKCRSRQFSATLSFPPTNHLANGGFHSRTFSHGCCHMSSRASRAQNFSGARIDSRYIRRYCSRLPIRAFFANERAGLKTRVSFRWDSIFFSMKGGQPNKRVAAAQRKVRGLPEVSDRRAFEFEFQARPPIFQNEGAHLQKAGAGRFIEEKHRRCGRERARPGWPNDAQYALVRGGRDARAHREEQNRSLAGDHQGGFHARPLSGSWWTDGVL